MWLLFMEEANFQIRRCRDWTTFSFLRFHKARNNILISKFAAAFLPIVVWQKSSNKSLRFTTCESNSMTATLVSHLHLNNRIFPFSVPKCFRSDHWSYLVFLRCDKRIVKASFSLIVRLRCVRLAKRVIFFITGGWAHNPPIRSRTWHYAVILSRWCVWSTRLRNGRLYFSLLERWWHYTRLVMFEWDRRSEFPV